MRGALPQGRLRLLPIPRLIRRSAFLKDPTLAVEAAIHSLEPRLPEMRRALADARHWLGYGDADRGPSFNSTAGNAAPQLVLHHAALRLPPLKG